MSNTHYDHNNTLSVNSIDNTVVAHANTPVIGRALKFLYAWWKRIFSKAIDLFGNASLYLAL
jgi:hypothetical protein